MAAVDKIIRGSEIHDCALAVAS